MAFKTRLLSDKDTIGVVHGAHPRHRLRLSAHHMHHHLKRQGRVNHARRLLLKRLTVKEP